MDNPKVLFLCTGNSARSQMAEAFLRAYAGTLFDVYSAGTEPKGSILPEVYTVMKELGLAMEGQFSKGVAEYLGKVHFAHVITVCADAEENCPVVFLNMGKHDHWSFDDPAKFEGEPAARLDFIRTVRDKIDRRIREWLTAQQITPQPIPRATGGNHTS
jgi:arsenate reductase (thioredoxin)